MPRRVALSSCAALLAALIGCAEPPPADSPQRSAAPQREHRPREIVLEPGRTDHVTEPDGDVIAITYTGPSGKAIVSDTPQGAAITLVDMSADSQLRVRLHERGAGGRASIPRIEVQGETVGSILVQGDIGTLRGGALPSGAQISALWPTGMTEGTIGELQLGRVDGTVRTKGMGKTWNIAAVGPTARVRMGDRSASIKGKPIAKGTALRIAGNVEGDIDLNCNLEGDVIVTGDLVQGSSIRVNGAAGGVNIAGRRDGKVVANAEAAPPPPTATGKNSELHRAAMGADVGQAKRLIAEGANVHSRGRWGRTPLHEAADLRGDLPMLRLLVESGADVNARDNEDATPLAGLAFRRRSDSAQFLIAKGADVNVHGTFGRTPLHHAASQGDLDLVKLLIARGADVNANDEKGETPLHEAAENGRDAAVALLLEYGADMRAKAANGEMPAERAARKGHTSTFEIFQQKGAVVDLFGAVAMGDMHTVKKFLDKKADVNARSVEGDSPLHIAADAGHVEIAELLIRKGALIEGKDRSGKTPLHKAARVGRKEIVDLLIRKGAGVNASDAHGVTPLHEAVRRNAADVVELLIAKGANVNAKDTRGATPLACSPSMHDFRCVELLVSHGADVNVKGVFGYTPLHNAVRIGNMDVVKMLIEKGADPNARAFRGETPLQIAQGRRYTEIADLLLAHGADATLAPQARPYSARPRSFPRAAPPNATPGAQLFGLPPDTPPPGKPITELTVGEFAEEVRKFIRQHDLIVVAVADENRAMLGPRSRAVQRLLTAVQDIAPDAAASGPPRLRWAVVGCDRKPRLLLPPTNDLDKLVALLRTAKPEADASCSPADAISFALNNLGSLRHPLFIVLLVEPDGAAAVQASLPSSLLQVLQASRSRLIFLTPGGEHKKQDDGK